MQTITVSEAKKIHDKYFHPFSFVHVFGRLTIMGGFGNIHLAKDVKLDSHAILAAETLDVIL